MRGNARSSQGKYLAFHHESGMGQDGTPNIRSVRLASSPDFAEKMKFTLGPCVPGLVTTGYRLPDRPVMSIEVTTIADPIYRAPRLEQHNVPVRHSEQFVARRTKVTGTGSKQRSGAAPRVQQEDQEDRRKVRLFNRTIGWY